MDRLSFLEGKYTLNLEEVAVCNAELKIIYSNAKCNKLLQLEDKQTYILIDEKSKGNWHGCIRELKNDSP